MSLAGSSSFAPSPEVGFPSHTSHHKVDEGGFAITWFARQHQTVVLVESNQGKTGLGQPPSEKLGCFAIA